MGKSVIVIRGQGFYWISLRSKIFAFLANVGVRGTAKNSFKNWDLDSAEAAAIVGRESGKCGSEPGENQASNLSKK